jgi:microcystin degradation protein MlrC
MRVGIIAIQHESNTFVESPTKLEDFLRRTGAEIRREFEGGHHEIGGFFEGLAEAQIDAVPIFTANAIPAGIIAADTCDALVKQMLDELRKANHLDGILAAPHGAAVAENHRDMDGHWLTILRETVGRKIPIISTLDLHSNLSQRMIDACDATIAYRTNPHLDQRARGSQAASLMSRTLRKEISPTQAATFPRIAINIERQLTSDSPCRELIEFADAQRDVLSNSCVFGFPYADVEEMGSSFIAVTDNDPALAKQRADELANYVINNRQQFVPQLIGVEEALDLAERADPPVCLLDIGDNIGGGAPGNSTVIADALHRRRIPKTFVALWHRDSVAEAANAREVTLPFGRCRVVSMHDGDFTESHPRHGGKKAYKMGPTAIVESAHGMTIMLTTQRTPPFSLNQLRSCNLDPSRFNILVAKGVHAPVAAYREVCKTFIRVNTPGVTCADMTKQAYRYRRRPLFPFEAIDAQ